MNRLEKEVEAEYVKVAKIRPDHFHIVPLMDILQEYYKGQITRDMAYSKSYDYLYFNELYSTKS